MYCLVSTSPWPQGTLVLFQVETLRFGIVGQSWAQVDTVSGIPCSKSWEMSLCSYRIPALPLIPFVTMGNLLSKSA